jgi:hypothetical protein
MPEITAATENLRTAIEQTREEILEAEFATRFRPVLSDNSRALLDGPGSRTLSPRSRELAEKEGEQGLKRSELLHGIDRIEGELGGLIARLVELRTNLAVSKTEM